MKNVWLKCLALLALFGTAGLDMHAQEIVHAVTGVVTGIDPKAKTITIKTNDDSLGTFRYQENLKTDVVFDKEVRVGTTVPNQFNKLGDHVVAYYYAGDSGRTILAIKDFGAAPLSVATGTVVKSKRHEITIKTDAGATITFDIAKDASAETPGGVVSGSKFNADEGTRVIVRYTESNGMKLAQFIRNAFG